MTSKILLICRHELVYQGHCWGLNRFLPMVPMAQLTQPASSAASPLPHSIKFPWSPTPSLTLGFSSWHRTLPGAFVCSAFLPFPPLLNSVFCEDRIMSVLFLSVFPLSKLLTDSWEGLKVFIECIILSHSLKTIKSLQKISYLYIYY